MKRHSSKILRIATHLSSREAGFIFATIGVFVQAAHTWFITYELSSLSGFMRFAQAGLMAFFISAALLYFTLKSSNDDTKEAKKYRTIVWWFAIIESFINLYYWGYHLLIETWPQPEYGKFIIALPFSILLPFTLKAYSSEVRTSDFSEDDDNGEDNDSRLQQKIEELEHDKTELTEKLDILENEHSETKIKLNAIVNKLNDKDNEYDELAKEHNKLKNEYDKAIQSLSNIKSQSVPVQQKSELVIEEPVVKEQEQDKETKNTPDISLGQQALGAIANGVYKTTPAYVAPKEQEDDLFNYDK